MLTKQQRIMLKIQKERVISISLDSDLCISEHNLSSVDSEDFTNEQAHSSLRTEMQDWKCNSFFDRQLLLGIFENKPKIKLIKDMAITTS